ncbi:MAG: hypothetical protein P8X95_16435 [Anaerolineales bacterium]|jgi:hypothetical protein
MSDQPDGTNANESQGNNEGILEKITKALEDLVTLEIKTMVGEMTFNQSEAPNFPAKPKAMYSKINLLQGDITTVYDPEFVTGEYTNLREFHQEREKQGQEIIQGNIRALQSLVKLIKEEGLEG